MTSSSKSHDITQLDALTDGAFTAPTSGERATRIRAWLSQDPPPEQLQEVFRELSSRDKGAARAIRERLDEIRRAKGQEQVASEWAAKGSDLLALAKLNIADALAWQRDAAKAGAPLSKEPLLGLRAQLAERVRVIEDLQHTVQVQREAAVLLAQRIEVLSTKPFAAAQAVWDNLREDVARWQEQAAQLVADANWPSVDLRFPPLLEASRAQLLVVWDAFEAALAQAVAAAGDVAAPLPPVAVWAEELRVARGAAATPGGARPGKLPVDPAVREEAGVRVRAVLATLESEMAQGHGKASAGAAAALRQSLKEFGKLIDDALENQAHAALAAAGELEGWQRWRADQLRNELVAKAEGLLKRPPGQAIGGRKMQETLRALREQWKQTDQGGAPNHGLWKRFDEACTEAHAVVQAWIEKAKADAALHRAQRLELVAEVKAWAAENATARDGDWRGFGRILHQFADRWRDGGHVGEKLYAELLPQWQEAIALACAPLEAAQQSSLERRTAMIAEAGVLGAAPQLRVDAIKALQQRWQAEAQAIPIERRQEQKLWDAFRKPIDEAFERKTAQRRSEEEALGQHDRTVLEASKALDAANAGGDAQQIRRAMADLEAALRGQTQPAVPAVSTEGAAAATTAAEPAEGAPPEATAPAADTGADHPDVAQAVRAAPKPVVAMRGDDRPGQRRADLPPPGARGGPERRDRRLPAGGKGDGRNGLAAGGRSDGRMGQPRGSRGEGADGGDRPALPRLGDAAFRAQREAMERAQTQLRKLASQAHGEALTQLLGAWQARDPQQLPSTQQLGSRVGSAVRTQWAQALGGDVAASSDAALLRLEMAAELPTPAEHLAARRSFQLQLLTRRNDPAPAQTWAQDVGTVFRSPYAPEPERRLRAALRVLLKG